MASVSKRQWTHNGVTNFAWVVRYTDLGGRRRERKCASKKDADRYRIKVEGEMESGVHAASTNAGAL